LVSPAGLCPDRVASAIRPSLAAVRLRTADELWLICVLHDVHRTSLVEPAASPFRSGRAGLLRYSELVEKAGLCPDRVASAIRPSLAA